ncbi:formylglycine-generating enzyme family protein [Zavarzinia compransoris]|uniref:Gliding motility-associated lipoprotein GldK n=1 Tax=Zavarzinia compransoris TaxID=1264899 RepID=A0A317DTR2_9PROT|nr:formylglycine-generating enzyme family protein [Zavarzinia compransoris]PWR18078.1 gliding motility-associated lipoprotein GldK [Zavarzinia compransoris]TDP43447.1 formylglycine-generating enzyme required for sulfatase activity [Zavarzinia compransoris]
MRLVSFVACALALIVAPAALALVGAGRVVTAGVPRACLTAMPAPVALPAGVVNMGEGAVLPGEGPARPVAVAGFEIDATDVTNDQFAAFVAATGHVTLAERLGSSLVFVVTGAAADLADPGQWWRVMPGANWRRPEGPGSSLRGRGSLPVVHVAREDALAYARWRGRDLPGEAEWEYAARGGLAHGRYPWGDAPSTAARPLANTWQGAFPAYDLGADGYKAAASPVGCYPANGFGLYDMAGNVWQWTADTTPAGEPVIKGGSFLCSDDFCFRARPAARLGAAADTTSSHIGFRTVRRPASGDRP